MGTKSIDDRLVALGMVAFLIWGILLGSYGSHPGAVPTWVLGFPAFLVLAAAIIVTALAALERLLGRWRSSR